MSTFLIKIESCRSQTVKTEEDSRQLIMKRCMLRGTNVRYCKSVLGTRRQYGTWFIVVLNTGLRPRMMVSEIIAIAEKMWVNCLIKCL